MEPKKNKLAVWVWNKRQWLKKQRAAITAWLASHGAVLVGSFVFLAAAAAPHGASAADRYLSFGYLQQHVLVQRDNVLGLYPAQSLLLDAELLLASTTEPLVERDGAAIATSAAFVTTDECGNRASSRLVLCLDEKLELTASDQLQLLKFAESPIRAHVRSSRAAVYLRNVLAQIPDRLVNALIAQEDLVSCAFACERVIVVEKVK